MITVVILVVIGALVVSAFSWAAITRFNESQRALTGDVTSLSASSNAVDTSDYYFRHLELSTVGNEVNTSDYYFRHLKPSTFGNEDNTSDYYFRHLELNTFGNKAQQAAATEQRIRDAESARWMGAALASQVKSAEQRIRDVESARWMGAGLASQAQGR